MFILYLFECHFEWHPTLDCSTHISPRYYRILHERILPGAIAQIDRLASQAAVQLNGSTKTSLKNNEH